VANLYDTYKSTPTIYADTASPSIYTLTYKDTRAPDIDLPELIRPQYGRFRPTATMMIGRRGQGKTLFMTLLAYIMKRRYRQRHINFRVFANYKIHSSIADECDPYILDRLADPRFGLSVRNGLLNLDEIQSAASSRRSMARGNVFLSGHLTQIRKQRLDVCFTTQFPQVIDYQVLLQCDLFVRCELLGDGEAVRVYVFDWWGQYTGNDSRKPWPPPRDMADWVWTFSGANRMFPYYDSEQYIPSAYLDQAMRDETIQASWGPGLVQSWDQELSPDELDIARSIHESAVATAPDDALAPYLRGKAGMFQLEPFMREIRGLVPGIERVGDLRAALEAKGYTIDGRGRGQTFAVPPHQGV